MKIFINDIPVYLISSHKVRDISEYDLVLKKLQLRDVVRYDFGLNYAVWEELQNVIHAVTNVPLEEVELTGIYYEYIDNLWTLDESDDLEDI